ncbi:hypothetical protein CBS101457_001346 [Exobasidium rhododendri]|nr:hypothetical protein CBS101457_001346 [Exobasidium rhododendri]
MSYNRQAQSKAQNDANAKTLRALVKLPENKVCVDCKRNDPRWASWNIGCFLCIRCSGIHRSMGTHISKVKSIDLDIWTPEQMASVQQWGNKLCNLYWEAHLKAGHIPPEHKVESFIRSKYETRRWAKEGPPPSDPSILDESSSASPAAASSNAAASSPPTSAARSTRSTATSAIDLLGGDIGPGAATTSVSTSRQSSLLDDAPPSSAPRAPTSAAPTQTSNTSTSTISKSEKNAGGGGGLFDLDWHAAPASPAGSSAPTSKGNKNDILSLFAATTSPRTAAPPASGSSLDAFGGLSLGGQQPQQHHQKQQSNNSASNPWGFEQLSATQSAAAPAIKGTNMFTTQDVWGAPATSTPAAPSTNNDIWGEMTSGNNGTASSSTGQKFSQNNDAFADIWK